MTGAGRQEQGAEGRPPRPPGPPTPASMANVAEFAALVESSLDTTRAAAEKWRTGLAALLTLVTTGLLVSGHSTLDDMPVGWRAGVSVLLVVGLGLAVAGLWYALAAASGVPGLVSLDDIVDKHGSVAGYRLSEANRAARQLATARWLVLASLVVLLSGVVLSWWAPSGASSGTSMSVTTESSVVCGAPVPDIEGEIRLDVAGSSEDALIPLSDVVNLEVVPDCPNP